MSKYNKQLKTKTLTTNKEGGLAYTPSLKLELMLRVMSFLMSGDSYYSKEKETSDRIAALVKSITAKDPWFVLKLAEYARDKMHLRTVPMYLLVEYAKTGAKTPEAYKHVPQILRRADEPAEALAYYMESTGSRKIPAMLKKGIGETLNRFDAYQLAKYNRDAKVTLKDVIFLCHPKPKDDAQQALYDKIVAGTLEPPETWEVAISAEGSTKEAWTKIIPKMGYMALLRNLRNFVQKKVDEDMYVPIIESPTAVKNAKQFPYRFLSAMRELELSAAPSRVLDAVHTAMDNSVVNVPKIPGTTAVFCDNSGSMRASISTKSKVKCIDVAALFGAISMHICDKSMVGVFGDKYATVPLSKKSTILDNMRKIAGTNVGHSTEAWKAVRYLTVNGIVVDRIFIFSDMQCYDVDERYSQPQRSLNSELKTYRKEINPKCRMYSFDVQSYGLLQFPEGDPLTCPIAGYSDSVFTFVNMFEGDHTTMLKEIEGDE